MIVSGLVVAAVLVVAGEAPLAAPAKTRGKVVSARLVPANLLPSEARTTKLVCRFAPASERAVYLLQAKTQWGWVKVRSVTKTHVKGQVKMSVKTLFGPKKIREGQFRIKVSADLNSISRKFTIFPESAGDDQGDEGEEGEDCDAEEGCDEPEYSDPSEDPEYDPDAD